MEVKIIKAIIIDDEKEACLNLKNIIENYVQLPGLQVLATTQDTAEAEQLIRELTPDVVFIDIDMPVENAFEFLERIAPFSFEVIFITAYDEYAIKAFKINALDYILKPISIAEVKGAVEKLKTRIDQNIILNVGQQYKELAELQLTGKDSCETLKLRTTKSLDIVSIADIIYLEAKGAYSNFYTITNGIVKEIIVSRPISQFQEMLPKKSFFRVHKSFLVNCAKVKSITSEPNPGIIINEKIKIPVSRRRYSEFLEFLYHQ